MAKPKKSRPASRTHGSRASEWVGGVFALPFDLGEAPGARPTLALWLEEPSGQIVASLLADGDDLVTLLVRALRKGLERPRFGRPRLPTRVRVDGHDAAQAVRQVLGPSVPVLVAATPELTYAAEDFTAHLARSGRTQYLLGGEIAEPALRALFSAAEQFAKLAPWRVLGEEHVVRANIGELGIAGAAAIVIGQAGESRALLMFPSAASLLAYEAVAATMQEDPGAMPEDMGSSVLSVSFEPEAELDPAAMRWIRERRYPLASSNLVPVVEHRDRTGAPMPVLARDIDIARVMLAGMAEFIGQHGATLKRGTDAARETTTQVMLEGKKLTVSIRHPHEEYRRLTEGLHEVASSATRSQAAPPASTRETEPTRSGALKVGRNDPCPCGSGKKFKKCCAALQLAPHTDAPAPRASQHERDEALAYRLNEFAERELEGRHRGIFDALGTAENVAQIGLPLSVYRTPVDGRPVAAHYLERHGARVSAAERAWLAQQMAASLAPWEVIDVTRGERMTVRNLISDEVRHVIERSATQVLVRHDVILARMLEAPEGTWLMCGCHPRTLGPTQAEEVLQRVRRMLRLGRQRVSPKMLEVDAEIHWVSAWRAKVEEIDHRPPPRLVNTDGDDLLQTIDHFEFEPTQRAEILKRVQQIPWAAEPDEGPGAAETTVSFLRPGNAIHASWENTAYGTITIAHKALRIETNSTLRADTLRSRLEGVAGPIVRHRLREHQDPTSAPFCAGAPSRTPEAPPPELQAMLAEHVMQMMRAWPDQNIPALGGKTPRAAVRTKQGRAQVDLLLREMERAQQRGPGGVGAGFDAKWLREELGM